MDSITVKAYAKVNLILNILGKRPDGYHEIQSLMHAVDLFDRVTVTLGASGRVPGAKADGAGITVKMTDEKGAVSDLPQKDNLAYKAALLAIDAMDIHSPVEICIEKHIPMAGGLGGGSSDGAAVLNGLGILTGFSDEPKEFERLLELGAQLGSDVPFCIAAQHGFPAAVATGRGCDLRFVAPLDLTLDICPCGASILNKTAAVYGALRPEDYAKPYDIEQFLAADSLAQRRALMGNHLQAPALRLMDLTLPDGFMLCGAGPSMIRLSENGAYRTVL